MLSKQYGNGDTINFLYDQGRRLIIKESKNSNQNIINKYVYGYNKINLKTYEQRVHDNNKGDIFTYDEAYRLKNIKFNSPEPTNPNTELFEKQKSFQFDKVDNILKILQQTGDQTSEIANTIEGDNLKLNQYTRFDAWGMSYDANGNTTQKGVQQFTYDYRNQLISAQDLNTTVDFKYDPFGRRVEKTDGVNTTKYFYDYNQVIEERDNSDLVLKQYVYGNGIDEMILVYNFESGNPIPYYYHTNAIGSVTAISDSNGNLVEKIAYDTFGMPTITDSSGTILPNSTIENVYLFHGRRYDREINLYYYRARNYDPIMGRFLQNDPMGYTDSMNLYQAFNQNPVNYVDPLGKQEYMEVTPDGVVAERTMSIEELWVTMEKAGLSHGEIYDLVEQSPVYSKYLLDDRLADRIKEYKRDYSHGFWDVAKDTISGSVDEFLYTTAMPYLMFAKGALDDDFGYLAGSAGMLIFEAVGGKAIGWLAKKGGKWVLKKLAPEILERLTQRYSSQLLKQADNILPVDKLSKKTKIVRNPGGRLGGPLHQGKIKEIADSLRKKGCKIKFEEYIKTPGGFKKSRYADIIVTDPHTNKRWLIQVGKQTMKGRAISRELKAIADLEKAGWKVEFIPYNN